MANWISSKLKVAENLLQQIDQQAAESLRKNERTLRSDDEELKLDPPKTSPTTTVSLKDQLKKNNDYYCKINSDVNQNVVNSVGIDRAVGSGLSKTVSEDRGVGLGLSKTGSEDWGVPGLSKRVSEDRGVGLGLSKTVSDGDWTELLSTPSSKSGGKVNGVPGVNAIRGLRKQGGSAGKLKSSGSAGKSGKRSSSVGVGEGLKLSGSEGRLSSDGKGEVSVKEKDHGKKEGVSEVRNENSSVVALPVGKIDEAADVKMGVRSVVRGKGESNAASMSSEEGSDSESESGSTSDSEDEREREERRRRREKILAEKAAAKAAEYIKEQENMVARLEGEKESLEKILEERAKQQAKEASELQTTMMEVMEAAEKEKEKHNNTRMEALARLAKLETTNAELARSLVSAQWNLEVEVNQVAELRQQIELKEVAVKELRGRMSSTNEAEKSSSQLAAVKGVEFEREILEAEYSFLSDKVGKLQDKARTLETNIEITRKEIEEPTEVEVELKRRLAQLTDHLIQKQVQVEALASEKATLLFRIEAVTRLLDENKANNGPSSSFSGDLESGTWEFSNSKLRPIIEDRLLSGRQHLYSVLLQLESIFLVGYVFLKRNSTARLWAMVYLVCLHLWVTYILMARSQTSDEGKSGAVFSLENINNTSGR